MTKNELLTALIARRDALLARHRALLDSGDIFAAQDLMQAVKFACRQANEALMGR